MHVGGKRTEKGSSEAEKPVRTSQGAGPSDVKNGTTSPPAGLGRVLLVPRTQHTWVFLSGL